MNRPTRALLPTAAVRRLALPVLLGLAAPVGVLAAPGVASAQQAPDSPRAVTLGDGRVLVGEVVTTEAAGIRLRVPQGEIIVGFHEFRSVKPTSASTWRSQRDWEVIVTSPDDATRIWIEQAVRTYPATFVSGDDGGSRSLGLDARRRAKACAPADLTCAVDATRRSDLWAYVVTVEPSGSGGAMFRAVPSSGGDPKRAAVADLSDPEQVLGALDVVLGLASVPGRSDAVQLLEPLAPEGPGKEKKDKEPKDKKDKKDKKPKEKKDKEPREKKPMGESLGLDVLVPLPGYPSLKRGDTASFGMALGVTVPATALWVGATGSEVQSAPEHIALSVGGYYATTVFLNHVLGRRTLGKAALSVTPRRGNGATVRLDVRL